MEKIVSSWPDQKKLAVIVTVMFEVWSEGKAPPYSPMTTSLKPGTADLLGISWSQYGGKTGIWRLFVSMPRARNYFRKRCDSYTSAAMKSPATPTLRT